MSPNSVSLESVEAGRPFIRVQVEGPLESSNAEAIAIDIAQQVESIAGRPFSLLYDLRKVTSCSEGAARRMQQTEMEAATFGLETVAHLVAQAEMVAQLDAELKALGPDATKLIGNFTDENRARRFAAGLQAA